VTQIVRNRCAACHAAPASKGAGIVLLDANGNLAPMSPALMLMIQEDVKTGKMPQGGPELPDNELAIVSGWVGDHAPEIAAFLAQGIGR
jgi:mono/diheme cytochrome c family protein